MNFKLKEFKNWLELNGYSNNNNYYYLVSEFIKILPPNTNITKKILNNYLLKIKRNYTIGYTNNHIKAIRIYFKFLNLDISTPSLSKPIQKISDSISLDYFVNEVIPLIDLCFEDRKLQIKAILYLMFFTGLRKGEVVLLKRQNFDLKNNRIKVYAPKTKTERIVIYPKEVNGIFLDYFQSEEENINAFNLGNYSIDYIFKTLKPYLKNCNFRPHLLRKSFCTHLVKKGMNLKYIQKLTGHKSLQSLERYIDTNIDNVQKSYDDIFKGV